MALTGPQENDVCIALRAALLDYFTAVGVPPIAVVRAFQTTQQGQEPGDVLYFNPFPSRRYGWPQRVDEWDEVAGVMTHGESTQYEQRFQISAKTSAPEDPAAPGRTPADLLRLASSAVQSDRVLDALRQAGIGVLRVTELRLGYATDDREQFEPEPGFDVVLTYRNTLTDEIGVVETFELEIHRV